MAKRPRLIQQCDSMQCGVASLAMVCDILGQRYTIDDISRLCHVTREGVSMLGISRAAGRTGLKAQAIKADVERLRHCRLPAILHWNNNHFVVLYGMSGSGKKFYIADPAKGYLKLNEKEFLSHWIGGDADADEKGIAMLFEITPDFGKLVEPCGSTSWVKSARFITGHLRRHGRLLIQVALGLLLGCLLQLAMPFLTQLIVDVGIKKKDIGFIWLVLSGEVMIVFGRTAADFLRRWLVLHISVRINIELVSDFLIKLMKLPMSFFDTMLTGDLIQRIGDHRRVQNFITSEALNILFTTLTFVIFGAVLFVYNHLTFAIYIAGSIVYAVWALIFLRRRRALDFEMYEKQAAINGNTFRLLTSMQEIKLQNCEDRSRWEWENLQADLFNVQTKVLRLQQTQEAGSVFINELKNVLITVFVAAAVIKGEMTLGMMLAVQYIIGQLNSPPDADSVTAVFNAGCENIARPHQLHPQPGE